MDVFGNNIEKECEKVFPKEEKNKKIEMLRSENVVLKNKTQNYFLNPSKIPVRTFQNFLPVPPSLLIEFLCKYTKYPAYMQIIYELFSLFSA